MHFDNLLKLASNQAFAGDGYCANSVDLFQAQDLGMGSPVYLRIACKSIITGTVPTGVYNFQPLLFSTPMNISSGTLTIAAGANFSIGVNATITTSTNHGMSLGTQFFVTGGTLPSYDPGSGSKSVSGDVFYAIPISPTQLRFATTYANALAGNAGVSGSTTGTVTTTGSFTGPSTVSLFGVQIADTRVYANDLHWPGNVALAVGGRVPKPIYLPIPSAIPGFPIPSQVQNVPSPATPTTSLPYRWLNVKVFTGVAWVGTLDVELVIAQEDDFKFFPSGIQPGIS